MDKFYCYHCGEEITNDEGTEELCGNCADDFGCSGESDCMCEYCIENKMFDAELHCDMER